MKATETKYLLLLERIASEPAATHADLAAALDVPQSLVNRYLKRLAAWGAITGNGGSANPRSLTPRGRELLREASWQLLAFFGEPLDRLRREAISRLRMCAEHSGWRRMALYGATPIASFLRAWAQEAGIEVVAVCDEERPGPDAVRLEDLDPAQYDAFLLCDWSRAEDRVLLALLEHYAPVVNLFVENGRSKPSWG